MIQQSHSESFLCTLYSRIHLADFMFLFCLAQSTVLGFFSSRQNWDPPQPQESVPPPPLLWFRGGGGGSTLALVRGGHFTEMM
jgi:hypothetical protein